MKTVRIGLLLWSIVFLVVLSGCEKAADITASEMFNNEESVSEGEDHDESEEERNDSDDVNEDEDDDDDDD